MATKSTTSGTKHALLTEQLKTDIASGRLMPGDLLESESQLCRRFGVSRGPARQALACLEEERLIYRVPGKGSFVAEVRKPAPSSKQLEVLIDVSRSIRDSLVLEVIEELNEAASHLCPDYRLTFAFHPFNAERDREWWDLRCRDGLAGFLVIPLTHYCTSFLSTLRPGEQPVVSFFRRLDSNHISQFYIDHEDGACRATEYLIHLGHKRIGILLGAPASKRPDSVERLNGYKRALDKAGLAFSSDCVAEVSLSAEAITATVRDLLSRDKAITAILIGGRILTTPCLQAIHALGLKIPDDLSVIACDDTPEALVHSPPLTTIGQPLQRGAQMALEKLLSQLSHPNEKPISIGIKPEIVIRESCAEPR